MAIESSCDDTGVAVLRGNEVLSNLVANQMVHSRFGGVVPELASRAHQSNIIPTVTLALGDAGVNPEDIDAQDIQIDTNSVLTFDHMDATYVDRGGWTNNMKY